MSNQKSQSGFSIVEIILVVAVLAIGVAVGIFGMKAFNSATTVSNTNPTSVIKPLVKAPEAIANNVPVAPVINSIAGLDTANVTLDSINLDDDSGDAKQLDSQLVGF